MSNTLERRGAALPVSAERFERPDLVRRIMGEYDPTFQILGRLKPFFDRLPLQELSVIDAAASRERALARTHLLPQLAELDCAAETFTEAAIGSTSEPHARAMVGLMLDCLPSAKSLPSASYIDALVDTLLNDDEDDFDGARGYTPTVLAASVRAVWRDYRFAPAISEFLTVARAERRRFWQAAGWTGSLWRVRRNAEAVLIATGDLADMDDSIPL